MRGFEFDLSDTASATSRRAISKVAQSSILETSDK